MQLSAHFSLEALTASETAARRGIDNAPTPSVIVNLTRLADSLERVRTILGNRSIHINSGYRSPALNAIVGGAKISAHMDGLAADIVCPSFGTPLGVCAAIEASGIDFDQIIYEFGAWCHFAIAHDGFMGRKDILTIKSAVAGYQQGLIG